MVFPQTLVRLVIGSFVLTAIPLCIALAQLALNLNDLARRSQVAVKRAEQVGVVSRELRESAISVERSVRQVVVLDDPTLLDDYANARKNFTAVLERLQHLPLEPAEREPLKALTRQEETVAAFLANGVPAEDRRGEAVESAIQLSESADRVVDVLEKVVAREITDLETQASKGRADWPWMVGIAALSALVLGIGSSIVVSRPLSSLDRSIRRMGQAQFDTPVTIKGPPDLRSLGERLEWLRLRLHQLESHQANFLRQVSHELKTPLTAIREGTELLNDRVPGELNEGQEEVVRIIRDNSVQLQKLITDLLTYQQHRSAVPLKVTSVFVPDVIQSVVESHRIASLAKALTIRAHAVPITLSADRERLRVVMDNLISNAVKFSPKAGQVLIAARVVNGACQIDVSDQGVGVAEEDKARIFDSFYQGDSQAESRVKGTGLGLAIAREFVVEHGGTIEVVDAGKPGGRFRVRIPLDAGQLNEFEKAAALAT